MGKIEEYCQSSLIYEGKAKKVFNVKGHSELVWLEFKDDLTAFNAQKKGSFEDKGQINLKIATILFKILKEKGIENHWICNEGSMSMIALKSVIIPIEVVVRNVLAGSTAKKFNFPEGKPISSPLTEFFYKDDDLGDPFISDEQALMLEIANDEELKKLKSLALKVNQVLINVFDQIGVRLIDFKLEFGRLPNGTILLCDEITPDSCRLWDKESGEKLDKDRFRRDLGDVKKGYQVILDRLSTVAREELKNK